MASIFDARNADLLGEGVLDQPQAPMDRAPQMSNDVYNRNLANQTASYNAVRNPAPSPAPPGAAQAAFDRGNIGGAGGAYNTSRGITPSNPGGMYGGGLPVRTVSAAPAAAPAQGGVPMLSQTRAMWDASTGLGAAAQQQGQAIQGQQAATAAGFQQAGQGFNATAQSAAAQPTPYTDPRTGQRQMTQGLGIGERVSAQPTAAAPMLSQGQLGGAPQIGGIANVAGQLGAGPQAAGVGSVAGRLGAGPTVGNVGNIAGRLGGAPQVAQVGNIQAGAAPGQVMGALGNMGAQNANQAGFIGRVNDFLDSPEGPSIAEAQLRQSQADNMAQLIGAARSGRGGAGAQAQALRGAMSEGSAVMSDTAGQLATLRAQEADMLKNRQLSAIGLGGQMSEAQRAGDLSFRGQDLSALQGDQSTALGARGQDIQTAMANQSTQTALEQLRGQLGITARGQDLSALTADQSTALGLEGLRAQTGLATRGQDLSALQGDQGTAAQMSLGQLQADLGARGQNLSALQGDQSTGLGLEGLRAQTALGARGQDLSLLQGNQQTALGARGQDMTRELGLANVNLGMRGQDASVLTSDADRNLAAQRVNLDAGLGYGALGNQATGQGLDFLSQANQQALVGQGMANDALQRELANTTTIGLANQANDTQRYLGNRQIAAQPSFGEQLALNSAGALIQTGGMAALAMSDERAKEGITSLDVIKGQLDEHLRVSPGKGYRYRAGVGEDPDTPRAGPMAQDLERSPFGRDIVKMGPDGFRRVDAGRLALVDHAALTSMRSELDELKARLG